MRLNPSPSQRELDDRAIRLIMDRRDLNPHKPARMAMWLYGAEYAKSGLGSMRFWDRLEEYRKNLCREAVRELLAAEDEK